MRVCWGFLMLAMIVGVSMGSLYACHEGSKGLTFHLVVLSVWMSGFYLLDCSMMAVVGNLSWQQYVNSKNWIIFGGVGIQ